MAKKNKFRQPYTTIFIGRNGTGKSYLAHKILKSVKRRAIVVTASGAPKIWRQYPEIDVTEPGALDFKSGIRQVFFYRHEKKTFEYLHTKFRDGIIIFDDCRAYLTKDLHNDMHLKGMLIEFRHYMQDLWFIVHAPSEVPKAAWPFTAAVFVGPTGVLFDKSRVPLDNVDEMINAQKKVNAAFRIAKARNDNSQYGLFIKVSP